MSLHKDYRAAIELKESRDQIMATKIVEKVESEANYNNLKDKSALGSVVLYTGTDMNVCKHIKELLPKLTSENIMIKYQEGQKRISDYSDRTVFKCSVYADWKQE